MTSHWRYEQNFVIIHEALNRLKHELTAQVTASNAEILPPVEQPKTEKRPWYMIHESEVAFDDA